MSVFLTFGGGTNNFREAAKRLEKQAHATGIFDKVYCYLDEDLKTMNDFWSIHGSFVEKNPRLYGYAIWKPYLILKTLETMKDGERLFYADAGCEFDLDCENQKEDIIALADKWCNTFSGPKTVPVEAMCRQQGCQPEADGERWNCVSQIP